MTNEQAKHVFKPILIALAIVGSFSLAACINPSVNVTQIKQRGIICNHQDYNPETAANDIKLCRMGL